MDSNLQKSPEHEPVSAIVKKFIQHPSVVRVLSILCLCAAVPFAMTAAFWLAHARIFLMWCNVFWAVFMVGAFLAVRKLGIQRTFALALLLVALIFLGTSGVWMQMGYWILVVFNLFWAIVFLIAAVVVNPRRTPPPQQE